MKGKIFESNMNIPKFLSIYKDQGPRYINLSNKQTYYTKDVLKIQLVHVI